MHIRANIICNYYIKSKFWLPYSANTEYFIADFKCSDTLHKGDVDPKGPLGFELAAQKSSTV